MQIQAPIVMPKWEYKLTKEDDTLLKAFEDKVMADAMAHAKKVGGWVTIYWDGNNIGYEKGTVIGQANATGGNLNDLRKYYTMKYIC